MGEIKEENQIEEDEEEEEGPPPGFQLTSMEVEKEVDEDEDEDEGPPPGWSSIPPSFHSMQTSDVEMLGNEEVDEDEDGPPPGWHLPQSTSQPTEAVSSDVKVESNQADVEDKEEGPPPGWEVIYPHQAPPPSAQTTPPPLVPDIEMGRKPEEKKSGHEVAQVVLQSAVAPHSIPLLPTPPPSTTALPPISDRSATGKGQLVCGSCRRLLSYPRGSKYVRCFCCQTVNLVLEAHQVGQVKCGSCAILLMYSYGAPAVRCSCCRYVTEIGAHNKRPPLSVQQERRRPSANHVH